MRNPLCGGGTQPWRAISGTSKCLRPSRASNQSFPGVISRDLERERKRERERATATKGERERRNLGGDFRDVKVLQPFQSRVAKAAVEVRKRRLDVFFEVRKFQAEHLTVLHTDSRINTFRNTCRLKNTYGTSKNTYLTCPVQTFRRERTHLELAVSLSRR